MTHARLLAVACGLVGAQWLWAAGGKAVDPLPAYEMTARLFGGGVPARAALTAAVLVEAVLGSAMVLCVVRGLRFSLGLLVVFSVGLLVVRGQGGGGLACGCYSGFGATAGSVDDSLLVNGVMTAIVAALAIWEIWLGRGRPAQTETA